MKNIIKYLSLGCLLSQTLATEAQEFDNHTAQPLTLGVTVTGSGYFVTYSNWVEVDIPTNVNFSANPTIQPGGSFYTPSFGWFNGNLSCTLTVDGGSFSSTNIIPWTPQTSPCGQYLMSITTGGGNWSGSGSFSCSWNSPTQNVYGISFGAVYDPTGEPGDTKLTDIKCNSCSANPAMAGYNFQAFTASLNISDTPLGYTPPVGDKIAFMLNYNQKEDFQSTNWSFSNLGLGWTFYPISFIQDYPNTTTNDVRVFPQGGGSEAFTGFNPTTGTYTRGIYSQGLLTRTSTNSYSLQFSDGSKQIYSFADSNSTRHVFLTQNIDPSGNVTSFNYIATNGVSRLQSVVDAIGQTNTLTYGLTNDILKITAVTDPFGRSATFSYISTNGMLQLASSTDPMSITSQYQYGPSNFVNALITPYGATRFAYTETSTSRVLTATDPMGATECVAYYQGPVNVPVDSAVPPVYTDTNNLGSFNTYYWSKQAYMMGGTNIANARITHWAAQGGVAYGIQLYTKAPLESAVWYNYPGQSNSWGGNIAIAQPAVVARALPTGNQISAMSYDSFGNVTNAVDPLGRSTSLVYSTNGVDLLTAYQGTDLLAQYSYNNQHLPIYSVVAGSTNWFGYTTNGLLKATTNGLNQTIAYNYNAKGYLTNVVGHTIADTVNVSYDTAGRIYSLTDSDGYSITNTYDSLDRLTNSVMPDGTFVQQVYNILDVIAVHGRDNRWSYFTQDANRHLTDVEATSGQLFHFEYCACGALNGITDPKGQPTMWSRDVQSRPTGKLYADLTGDTINYEATTSRLKKTTDAAGKSTQLAYNLDDSLAQATFSLTTPSVSYTYDNVYSRVTQLVNGTGTNQFTYVPAGQAGAGSIQSINGPLSNNTITYGYDALGRPLTLQIGTATSAVQYDTLGRVWWSSNQLGVATIAYVNASQRPASIKWPNGFGTSLNYTPVSDGSRLQSMITTNSTGSLIESYAFAYDINNLITTQTNVVGGITNVWSYSYDLAQELTGAIQKTNGITAHRYSYTYDLAGNRLSEQVDNALAGETPNQLNQLTGKNGADTVRVSGYLTKPGTASINGTPAAMLTQTNFTSMLYAGVGTNTYSVTASDFNGHSATNSYSFVATQNGLNTALSYDLAGNLIKKSSSSQTLTFAWDGLDRCVGLTNGVYRTIIAYDGMNRWTRITEYSSTNQTADRRFVWNGTTLAEERDASGSNVVKRFFGNGFTQTGTNYYYVKDQMGSVVEVSDGSGNIVASFSYDPYGKRTQTYGSLQVDYGFAGLFEHQSGLQFAVFRFKDGARWINRDPIREQGGWNLYAYCGGDPIGATDENGLIIDTTALSSTDLNTYRANVSYLMRSATFKAAYTQMSQNQDVTIHIVMTGADKPSGFLWTNQTVYWNPLQVAKSISVDGQKFVLSQSIGIAHELGHAYHYSQCPASYPIYRQKTLLPEEKTAWGNFEEVHNIMLFEWHIDKDLGLPLRLNHQ